MRKDTEALASFSLHDVDAVISETLRFGVGLYSRQAAPKAILLVGQPGAGKTVISAMFTLQFQNDIAFINGDDYRRYHPNYQEIRTEHGSDFVQLTSAFSNAVVERTIEVFSDHGFHLMVEGTGRDPSVPQRTAKLLTAKGYLVELAVLAARPEQSLISTLLRFYQMNDDGTAPRATAITAHDHVVDVLPANLDTLFREESISKITIRDRDRNCIYDSSTDRELPSAVLTRYWTRPWTKEELQQAREQVLQLWEKERTSQLGQRSAIEELESRLSAVEKTFT